MSACYEREDNELMFNLKKIFDNPITFLNSYFEQLQQLVEQAFDQLIKNSTDLNDSNRTEISQKRAEMIEKIKSFKTECITNAENCFKQSVPLFSRQIQSIQNESLNSSQDEKKKKELSRSILMETVNLKRFLFMNKTLAFIERSKCDEKCILSYLLIDQPKTSVGKLFFIKNYFISDESIQQLHKQ